MEQESFRNFSNRIYQGLLTLIFISLQVNTLYGQTIFDEKKIYSFDGVEYKTMVQVKDIQKEIEITTYRKKNNDSISTTKFNFDELFRGYQFNIYNSIIRLQGDSNGVLLYDFINKEKFYTKMWFHRNNENLKLGIFNPVILEETQELVILNEHLNIIKKLKLNPNLDNQIQWSIEDSDVMSGVIKLNKYTPIKLTLNKTVQGFTYFVKTNKLQKNVIK